MNTLLRTPPHFQFHRYCNAVMKFRNAIRAKQFRNFNETRLPVITPLNRTETKSVLEIRNVLIARQRKKQSIA